MSNPAFAPDTAPLEVLPRDLSAYRQGNTGIDYVHRFESGKPGPHVLVNALTHGNEICGMVAATHLLDTGVRPKIGTLTVSFANIEAYDAFDIDNPYENRQLVHNLNRIWSPQWLDGDEQSPELRRARELRPVLDAADYVLDIHSTRAPVQPFWVYPEMDRNTALAAAVGAPAVQLVMPAGRFPGTGVLNYGRHGDPASDSGGALVVECGQHFAQSAALLATDVTLRFLAHLGLIDAPANSAPAAPAQPFRLLEVHMVKSEDFTFTRPLLGFEVFNKGELIAINAGEEIRSPCDNCTIFMPTRMPIVGREAVYLTEPM
ncbi:succinylglutamate desuccinylase [Achromobacter xylosoxidans]|uniref:succinylglutamate desuccinylase/aspartoacylase domain-containing protein n=1 Tax=Achromobacter ruhlandii TaxID=72557 RepID=UPI0006C56767|nr:succinylglutamate desuccinylase/aspartoacylase family protein [Achromobacter ruhlandii]AMG47320.1 succinylglutamate desuccinylase [Achromobacter xylosoxidans]MCV6800127.1 succinylglutamate desuccinylase/aspartoacylase family protein [Achromobacter ruhlandii]MCV6808493.1 succinylglutamate desuccinylase/aspartoacylase family protein [Achromobacter ruhlandii]MCV6822660.1 succinylglutamate desuccinylase/aspartoacylase family protein [Achromobacter ruhlandii]MEB6663868.1 succinylglutamate desucc